ncbi:MAG TPA: Uma2 family endonuclease [Xanthobacteraceae bacterium]|jgi:Uma2 family endonuclease
MNVAITRAAEGFPRRAFTVDDISRMMEAGVIGEDENFELIEGDLVVMAAKHVGHDGIKNALNMALARSAPDGVFVAIECSLQLAKDVLVEPDIAIVSRGVYAAERKTFARPRPEDVPLLIEIAASSLAFDREVKARLYARHGFREFWVIDADRRVTWVYTGPSGETWSSIVERGPQDLLTTPAVPGFAIRLADIR